MASKLQTTLARLRADVNRIERSVAARGSAVAPPPADVAEFIRRCVWLQTESGAWRRFEPWPAQLEALGTLDASRLNVWLKARQLGMTWLVLAYVLHTALTQPGATVLLFSRRENEATELLDRVKGMHKRLPREMRQTTHGSTTAWHLGNGARVLAFPCTAGDSYSATLAVIDEADLVPDLDRLMASVKPTIDAGGRMVLLSRPDKAKPNSLFKQTFRAARAGLSPWHPLFLPWSARPDRDAAWYEEQKRDITSRTGSTDTLWEQYPATVEEALAPNQLDKRIRIEWIAAVSDIDSKPTPHPTIPCCRVWARPIGERRYVIGGDPAEGNPTSDDSAATILDVDTGEQVAVLQGKIEPTTFAAYIAALSAEYHDAPALPERNNHGHAVIAALQERGIRVLLGHDGKPGWLSSQKGKVLLYTECADAIRDGEVLLRCQMTASQLGAIEGGTLRAPEGDHDDLADAFALACAGLGDAVVRRRPVRVGGAGR